MKSKLICNYEFNELRKLSFESNIKFATLLSSYCVVFDRDTSARRTEDSISWLDVIRHATLLFSLEVIMSFTVQIIFNLYRNNLLLFDKISAKTYFQCKNV